MTGILKVDQWKDSGDNALMTSDGAGNLTSNTEITVKSTTDTPSIVVNNTNDGKARMTFQENGTNRLEIGLFGGIVSGTSGATVIKAHEPLIFYDNGGETFRSQSGQILLGTTSEGSAAAGDVVLGGGIFIGGNANANKLDDYEEGTFTATLKGSTGNPSTLITTTGVYKKVGSLVMFQLGYENISNSGYSGHITVTGLPFTNTSASRGMANVGLYRIGTFGTGYVIGEVNDGGTTCSVFEIRSNDTWETVNHNTGSGRYMWITGTYSQA